MVKNVGCAHATSTVNDGSILLLLPSLLPVKNTIQNHRIITTCMYMSDSSISNRRHIVTVSSKVSNRAFDQTQMLIEAIDCRHHRQSALGTADLSCRRSARVPGLKSRHARSIITRTAGEKPAQTGSQRAGSRQFGALCSRHWC